ncbi:MAG: YedE family putative selenium transporter [Thermodesulfobacteriota bacterium]|nr:YedE family putative selenium transporter [Thermodesulfobacteriota bacterium]
MLKFFGSKKGIFSVGLFIGVFAALLQKCGNPPNMGICVACFERDIAGALGLHRADVVQYIRPEIIGFVLGALISSLIFREFKARAGSAPIVRFMLGFFAMIGALVFLGCPWRALLRLCGGDGNAILGLAGLFVGVAIGVYFLKSGYNLGRSQKTYQFVGWIMPIIMIGLLILVIAEPSLPSGAIFISTKGPGAMHAPLIVSLIIGLTIGALAQRSRFCTMGAIRDMILIRDFYLMTGILGLLIGSFGMNILLGQFNPGFVGQPVSHNNHVWNFAGMVLAGLTFAMAGGCPGRQLFLSGEGDGDSAVFVIGMITGAAFAHNFAMASSPKGVGLWGPGAVIVGLVFCIVLGFYMREKI